jgi:nitrogen fixation protein NifU and related proteins
MDLYREEMLDHYKNPRNFKDIPNATHQAHAVNPLCGDEINISAVVENGIIKDIGFQSQSCSITMATASMVTEHLLNKSVDEINQLTPEKIQEMLGVELNTSRVNCAVVVVNALKQAVSNSI